MKFTDLLESKTKVATTARSAFQSTPAFKTNVMDPNTVRTRVANINQPLAAASHMSNLMRNVEVPHDASDMDSVDNEDVDTSNIPVVLNQALKATGEINPQWIRVGDLPGMILGQIQAVGRELFSQYTSTDLEDIHVIANFGGTGPHEHREVNSVASWVTKHCTLTKEQTVDFGAIMPGYTAKAKLYTSKDNQADFLLVKDFAGTYIYAWTKE